MNCRGVIRVFYAANDPHATVIHCCKPQVTQEWNMAIAELKGV